MDESVRVEDYPSFGYWLRRRRKALDLTQAELARRAGCSAATIRKIEADERRPSLQLAELLAGQLQVPANQRDTFLRLARGIEISEGKLIQVGEGVGPPGHNLPPQVTPFVGRTAELAALDQFLLDPAVRLINILGPGGMGKTRLALAAAEAQLIDPGRFPQGVYFVSLAGVESADFLAQTIAEALDFQFNGPEEPPAQLLRYLRTKRVLLILDNFEHLLSGIRLVEELVHAAPEIKLLVTSREKLKLQSEQLFPIAGLTYPQEGEPLDQMQQYSAIELFVQCALRARPQFQQTVLNRSAIAAICRMVEGMPLGIVLAAAWLDTLTPAEIAREIGRDLDFLVTEISDVPGRQRSLHAAFNHSWRLLSEQEQDIYRQLSVFRGGFTAEAAASVAGASLPELQGMVNKSLLIRAPAQGGTTGRFEIHELLRQFAAQEMAADPHMETAVRDRHIDYYCSLLQRHEPHWRSSRQLETLQTLSLEADNITAAFRFALDFSEWERMAGAFDSWAMFHEWRGLWVEAQAFCQAVVERLAASPKEDLSRTADSFILWTKSLAWQGCFCSANDEALLIFERCLTLLKRPEFAVGDVRAIEASINRQLADRFFAMDHLSARGYAEESLRFYQEQDNHWCVADIKSFLARLDMVTGHYQQARERAGAASLVFRNLGDMRMQFWPTLTMVWVEMQLGNLDISMRYHDEALDLCWQVGDRSDLIYCIGDLTFTHVSQGKYHHSLRAAEQAMKMVLEYGHRYKEGWAHNAIGFSLLHLDRVDEARSEFERALILVQETGNVDIEASVRGNLGEVALAEGDYARAQSCFEEGLRLAEQTHAMFIVGKQVGLGISACQAGKDDVAQRYFVSSLRRNIRMGDMYQLVQTLPGVALYLARYGDIERAVEIWVLARTWPHVANSKWYESVIGQEITALASELSSEDVHAATNRGQALDFWQTAESLLDEL